MLQELFEQLIIFFLELELFVTGQDLSFISRQQHKKGVQG